MIEVTYDVDLHLVIGLVFDEKPTREELKRALIENVKDYVDRFSHRDIEYRMNCEPMEDETGDWPKFES